MKSITEGINRFLAGRRPHICAALFVGVMGSMGVMSASAAFTEFYCIAGGGANTNSGTTATASATYSSVNGNWDGSSVFTPTDGSSPSSSISAGDFAAVYLDGNTNATYEARILSVAAGVNGAITLSTVAVSGTAPSSGSTGRTITIGGAWAGPTLIGDRFPFSFVTGNMTNASGNCPRVNCKGTWFTTNGIVDNNTNGPVWFQGYTNTIADGGFANIYGSNNIAGYPLITIGGKNRTYCNFLGATNGNTGGITNHVFYLTGTENLLYKCVAHDAELSGMCMLNANTINQCEVWNSNLANNSSYGAIMSQSAGCIMLNCFSHDNTGSNAHGFETDGTQVSIGCISANNGGNGFNGTGDVQLTLIRCEAFNNGGHGIMMTGASGTTSPWDAMCINFYNCNFIKNGKCGITNNAAVGYYNGIIANCGFGTGTMTNATGDIEGKLQGVVVVNKIAYPADASPYVATNNFVIALNQAKGAGLHQWLNLSGKNYADTIGHADIGAAQHVDSGSGAGGGGNFPFAQ